MWIVWQPDPDSVYVSSGRDNLALHRAREPRTANGSPLDHLGFFVESPERVFAAADVLPRRGIRMLRPVKQLSDGSCSLYVADPDGNAVQILTSRTRRVDERRIGTLAPAACSMHLSPRVWLGARRASDLGYPRKAARATRSCRGPWR
jgi:hypothetical protein